MKIKKLLKIFSICVVALILLFIVFEIIYNFSKTVVAQQRVPKLRSQEEVVSEKELQKKIDVLKNSGIITGHIASLKVDECYVDSNDAGWFASSWYQRCYIRYVEGFETTENKESLENKLDLLPDSMMLFGEKLKDAASCLVRSIQSTNTSNIYSNLKLRTVEAYERECSVPKQIDEIFFYPNLHHEKFYRTYDPEQFKIPQSNQVWVELKKEYYYEKLGCGLNPILCSNPRNKPVFGD